jgi:hypothetical protein
MALLTELSPTASMVKYSNQGGIAPGRAGRGLSVF